MDQVIKLRNRQLHTRSIETTRVKQQNDSINMSDFCSTRVGVTIDSPRADTTRMRYRQSCQDSMMIVDPSMQPTRRVVNMKANLTGRSVRGAGALGNSNSPCSQSGFDPALVRGRSSQLNFAMNANEKQIQSISKSF